MFIVHLFAGFTVRTRVKSNVENCSLARRECFKWAQRVYVVVQSLAPGKRKQMLFIGIVGEMPLEHHRISFDSLGRFSIKKGAPRNVAGTALSGLTGPGSWLG